MSPRAADCSEFGTLGLAQGGILAEPGGLNSAEAGEACVRRSGLGIFRSGNGLVAGEGTGGIVRVGNGFPHRAPLQTVGK